MDSELNSAQENYEEIGSPTSSDSTSDWEVVVPPKRYSRTASIKRYTNNVQEAISTQGLLKKSIIPTPQADPLKSPTSTSSDTANSQSFSPPLATNNPCTTSIPSHRTGSIKKYGHKLDPLGEANVSELRQRLSQRREELCTPAQPQSPTEVYEEVQFSEQVRERVKEEYPLISTF